MVLKIEADPSDENSSHCAAKIYCCFCNEDISVRQYGRAKKNGEKGSERWVISNLETHLRSKHVGKLMSRRSASETDLKNTFVRPSTPEKSSKDDIDSDTASGEDLPRTRQERVLLKKKVPQTKRRKESKV